MLESSERASGAGALTPMLDQAAAGMGATAEEPAPDADLDHVADLWRGQQLDASWSDEARRYLESSFADLDTQGKVFDVSCRETLCRAVMTFESSDEANGYAEAAANPDVQKWIRVATDQRGLVFEVFFGKPLSRREEATP